ncbi:MAG: succinyl-CoA--3-ketoacid-CoA transferase [Eubacteriaceae bacterium]|jgi:3-oxoacid CoA-transferase B subunit|nr:succinyl-CoA--3-ketoacid-CoA transferase [Eubacteriaceae bacterium]
MSNAREIIARNIAPMLKDGDIVNLGVGMPTMVGNYVDPDMELYFHAENGTIGAGVVLSGEMFESPEILLQWEEDHSGFKTDYHEGHKDLANAGSEYITLLDGASCFDVCRSFAIARGGHLDVTVLGALQVDQEGSLANWMVPGKRVNGMGGAMDILSGAKKAIIAMEHCTKDGKPKLLRKCTMPYTAINCVDTVVTEKCIIDIEDGHFTVRALYPGVTREEIEATVEGELVFADEMKVMAV